MKVLYEEESEKMYFESGVSSRYVDSCIFNGESRMKQYF